MKTIYKLSLFLILIPLYLFIAYVGPYIFIGYKNLKSPYSNNRFIVETETTDIGIEKIKYVALGDSLTAGGGSYNTKDTFVHKFAENLAQNNNEVQVINLGISGAKTNELINLELAKAVSENPDIITLLIGINDIHNKSMVSKFKEKYQLILNELLSKTNSEIFVLTLPYLGSKYLVLPPYNYLLNFRTKQFNDAIISVVDSTKSDRIHVIDLYKHSYNLARNDKKYYSSDLFHPSAYGYALWGNF